MLRAIKNRFADTGKIVLVIEKSYEFMYTEKRKLDCEIGIFWRLDKDERNYIFKMRWK